jgi:hypothetical protein
MSGSDVQPVNKPNFFILGAAKSGTTSLFSYLAQHPDVFMPTPKEPTFFCEPFQAIRNPIKYFELFGAAGDAQAIGEASHAYLSNPSTGKVLRLLFPEAKFVVILRNPADRAYSLYHHMRRFGYEWIGTFERALQAEEKRARSPTFRKRCPQYYYNYLYFRSGLYGEQIERYLSLFDRQQFHFMTLEQLQKDPTVSLAGVLAFLNLSTDFHPRLEAYNRGEVTARLAWLQYGWQTKLWSPRVVRRLGNGILRKVNMTAVQPLSAATREALLARYQNDLARLYALTGVRFQDVGDRLSPAADGGGPAPQEFRGNLSAPQARW